MSAPVDNLTDEDVVIKLCEIEVGLTPHDEDFVEECVQRVLDAGMPLGIKRERAERILRGGGP